jgi:hypothetical protein
VLVAAEHLTAEAGELCERHRAEEPEPGDAEDRQEHGAVRAREADRAPGLREGIPADAQGRIDRGRDGHAPAREPAGDREREDRRRDQGRPVVRQRDQHAAEDRAEQDREERAHLHERVAADQLLLAQRLREDAVLHGPEERRVHAHHEQRAQQDRDAAQVEPHGADAHDRDLEELHRADQARLLEAVGELARGRREQEEGQDEHAPGEVHERVGRERRLRRAEREQDHERVLEHVVVQRAEKLRPEERREAARAQQLELAHALDRGRVMA